MKLIGSGPLSKMCVRLEDPVQYAMSLSGIELPLNKLIDSTTKMVFTGKIYCVDCGRKTNKSYDKIKHLNTGQTFETIDDAAKTFDLIKKSIQAVCAGEYQSTKSNNKKKKTAHSFCYIKDEKEILTTKHKKFIAKTEESKRYCLAVYSVDDKEFKHPILYDNSNAIINDPKLGISNQAHILL